MRDPVPTTIHLKDYRPPAFLIRTVDLDVALHEAHAEVRARLGLQRNAAAGDRNAPLVLNGDELELVSVAVDGRALAAGAYSLDAEHLTIPGVPDAFTLETVVRIAPRKNTKLMGLYASKDGFFTQCEAEGFRRITFFLDRPDVMARYTTTIHADKARYPGAAVERQPGRQPATTAPAATGRSGKTRSRSRPTCSRWSRRSSTCSRTPSSRARASARGSRSTSSRASSTSARFAMQALKKSMKWDEDVFGLELDLDRYMIVAVGDFNMGAMENKGLNIFNTKYVLARPGHRDRHRLHATSTASSRTSTSTTGPATASPAATGSSSRSRKGSPSSATRSSAPTRTRAPVQRIQEVRGLRAAQFPEDAGPMAHPVRPQSYMEISNFYTATVYEKGAEVVRMIHTLLGAAGFRHGMDLYFQRHDGQAVTTDDFVAAMADANGVDLAQFKRWYDQAGTPTLAARGEYDPAAKRYTLTVEQSLPADAGAARQAADPHSARNRARRPGRPRDAAAARRRDAGCRHRSRAVAARAGGALRLRRRAAARRCPSLLRGFSAPVDLKLRLRRRRPRAPAWRTTATRSTAGKPGSAWRSRSSCAGVEAVRAGRAVDVPQAFLDAFGRVLGAGADDPAFAAEALALPSETYVAEQMDVVDPDAIHAARERAAPRDRACAARGAPRGVRRARGDGPLQPGRAVRGPPRAAQPVRSGYLMELGDRGDRGAVRRAVRPRRQHDRRDGRARRARQLGLPPSARARSSASTPSGSDEPLVVDKWLAVQATSRRADTLDRVKALARAPGVRPPQPEQGVRADPQLLRATTCASTPPTAPATHSLAERVLELDPLNPQIAARLARAFDRWRKFDAGRQAHARAALERIRAAATLSKDVAEVVTKALV